jgi:hypothetical protein
MFKSNQLEYLDPKRVEMWYKIPGVNPNFNNKLYTYKYVDVPLFGVGPSGQPIIECDSYFDTKLIDGIADEFNSNLEFGKHRLHYMTPFGLIPKSINGTKCLDSYLLNLEKYDPGQNYSQYIQDINHYHVLKNYMAGRFNLNRPWKNVIHLKRLKTFFEKNENAEWNEISEHFPKLIKLIMNLPFKTIGYVMVMRNNENSKLDIHRDIYPRNHRCHHINIAIDSKPRPVFTYCSHTNTRYYKKSNSLSYFFNECDLHGADAVFHEGLTLRVDGVFHDWFAKEIGLEDSVTFDWAYDKPQSYINLVKTIPVIEETDI